MITKTKLFCLHNVQKDSLNSSRDVRSFCMLCKADQFKGFLLITLHFVSILKHLKRMWHVAVERLWHMSTSGHNQQLHSSISMTGQSVCANWVRQHGVSTRESKCCIKSCLCSFSPRRPREIHFQRELPASAQKPLNCFFKQEQHWLTRQMY